MEYIDYYKVIGLNKEATPDDIKKAYRRLARKFHPDLNPNDKEANKKFQQINEANEVLSNEESRKKYDQYGADWKHAGQYEQAGQQQPRGNAGGSYTGGFEGFSGGGDFSDFFSSMFGGGGQSRSSAGFRGQDYHAELQLNLTDAAKTHQRVLTVNGKNIRITIPAGVENGQEIRLKGHGAPGANGGPAGDLYIKFNIVNNTAFTRSGNDLQATVPLDLFTALLGGEVVADTLDAKIKLTIKPETANGTKVRLKGKGFPVYKKEGEAGDLFVTYNIMMPTNLTDKQRELFTELSKTFQSK